RQGDRQEVPRAQTEARRIQSPLRHAGEGQRETDGEGVMAGRPTKYDARYAEEGRKLALLGATDAEMAEFWGVTEKTLNNWKGAHPGFLQSLKEGKSLA